MAQVTSGTTVVSYFIVPGQMVIALQPGADVEGTVSPAGIGALSFPVRIRGWLLPFAESVGDHYGLAMAVLSGDLASALLLADLVHEGHTDTKALVAEVVRRECAKTRAQEREACIALSRRAWEHDDFGEIPHEEGTAYAMVQMTCAFIAEMIRRRGESKEQTT